MNKIETDKGLRSGISTGLNPRSFNGVDTIEIKNTPGFIISPEGQVEEWLIEKFIEQNGEMIALGPWVEDTRDWNPETDGPDILSVLIQGIRALRGIGYPLGGFYLRAVKVTPDGGIIVLPPKLESWIRDNSTDNEKQTDWEPWSHPDLSGEAAWSFSLGMLAWNLIADSDPCQGETGERRRERLRKEEMPSIAAEDGRLDSESRKIIDGALMPGKGRRPSLDDWEALIRHWKKTGIREDISDEEAAERSEKAQRASQLREKRLAGRRWIRKSLWKYLAIVAITAVVLAIVSAPIRKALETPETAGMQPLEVARTYYRAIDLMNSETMDDCLARKVGKADKQHVDMVFVTNKVRQGYEGISAPPRAEDWLAEGRPELPTGVWPWGITDLELVENHDGSITARYGFWYPREGTDPSAARAEIRVDTLVFTEARKSWEISSIERLVEN